MVKESDHPALNSFCSTGHKWIPPEEYNIRPRTEWHFSRVLSQAPTPWRIPNAEVIPLYLAAIILFCSSLNLCHFLLNPCKHLAFTFRKMRIITNTRGLASFYLSQFLICLVDKLPTMKDGDREYFYQKKTKQKTVVKTWVWQGINSIKRKNA